MIWDPLTGQCMDIKDIYPSNLISKVFLTEGYAKREKKSNLERECMCVCEFIRNNLSFIPTYSVVIVQLLSHVWLYNPMDCSLQGPSVHGISQAIILEWVAISFSRGSSRPRDLAHVSSVFTEPAGQPTTHPHTNSILFSTWR